MLGLLAPELIVRHTTMKPYYEDKSCTIYHGESLELIDNIFGFDLVIADPPYNFTTASAGCGKLNPWADLCNSAYWFSAWQKKILEKLELPKGALWQFCNWRSLPMVTKAIFDIGRQIESLLVWDKNWIGPGGQRGLRPSYELVSLICTKDFSLQDRGIPDIKKSQWSSTKPHGHPAEKPIELISWLIKISTGQTILDPFMGSGTTLRAAKDLGRKAIGIEMEEKYCEIAAKRLEQESLFSV